MKCRKCAALITPKPFTGKPKTAFRFADCYYICPNPQCGVAYSNCKDEEERTLMYPLPRFNIPEEIYPGIEEVSGSALNELNRTTKWQRLCFDTSEDAVTWSFFRFLQQTAQIHSAFNLNGEFNNLYFWGVPFPIVQNSEFPQHLKSTLVSRFEENPSKCSEPDVIIETSKEITFVEVKYLSLNDCERKKKRRYSDYICGNEELFTKSLAEIEKDGYYELCRNWAIGSTIANRFKKEFRLVNLGLADRCNGSATAFAESLNQTPHRRFEFLNWANVIGRVELTNWMDQYLRAKRLL